MQRHVINSTVSVLPNNSRPQQSIISLISEFLKLTPAKDKDTTLNTHM